MPKSKHILLHLLILLLTFFHPSKEGLLDYSHDLSDSIPIVFGPLTSTRIQIPYEYFRLGICVPTKQEKVEDNLGEILTGAEMYKSGYSVKTKQNQNCSALCEEKITLKKLNLIKWFIEKNYKIKILADKLPAALEKYDETTKEYTLDYQSGIPIGYYKKNNYNEDILYIYNHYTFTISVHKVEENKYEVVGFKVRPISKQQSNIDEEKCEIHGNHDNNTVQKVPPPQKLEEGNILFTYDVNFEESNMTLATRWDRYKYNTSMHLSGVIITNVMIICLTILIVIIFCRSVNNEIDSYNRNVSNNIFIDELAWRNLANDVFRPCRNRTLYSALLGVGIQLNFMLFFSLFFIACGILLPEHRGNLLGLFIIFFVFMALPGGFISTYFYRILGGDKWIRVSLMTGLLFPSLLFGGYFLINFVLVIEKSSAASNFKDILALLILWLCCSLPLVFIGGLLGYKKRPMKLPTTVNPLPLAIPDKECYFKTKYTVWVSGLITFSAIFIELYYVMSNLWQQQIYFIASFFWLAVCITIIISAEVTCIFIYINLCKGDYAWWWKSYFLGGSCVFYFIIYSIYYFFFHLNITRISGIIIYFALMTVISAVAGLITAGTSSVVTFTFIVNIYSTIKMD